MVLFCIHQINEIYTTAVSTTLGLTSRAVFVGCQEGVNFCMKWLIPAEVEKQLAGELYMLDM